MELSKLTLGMDRCQAFHDSGTLGDRFTHDRFLLLRHDDEVIFLKIAAGFENEPSDSKSGFVLEADFPNAPECLLESDKVQVY